MTAASCRLCGGTDHIKTDHWRAQEGQQQARAALDAVWGSRPTAEALPARLVENEHCYYCGRALRWLRWDLFREGGRYVFGCSGRSSRKCVLDPSLRTLDDPSRSTTGALPEGPRRELVRAASERVAELLRRQRAAKVSAV